MIPKAALIGYDVKLETSPAEIHARARAQIRFSIFEPGTGKAVKDLHIVHDKPFHLFVVSADFAVYQHLHPVPQPDGTLVVETVFPQEGQYEIICDFSPVGGLPQVIRRRIMTAANAGGARIRPALVPQSHPSSTTDGVRVDLRFEPSQLTAGTAVMLNLHLSDAHTGRPVRDLQPYLGAWGHTVVLSEDARDYVHSHPRIALSRNANGWHAADGGPDVEFQTFFPRAGRYRVWSQFQRQDKVSTVSFDVDVARLDSIAVWQSGNWSAVSSDSELNGQIQAIAASGTEVYTGGTFTQVGSSAASRIAKWDGGGWSALGDGVNGTVWAIAVKGKDVYIGGEFTKSGDIRVNGIAKWDGHKWWALGEGVTGCKDLACAPTVYALALSGNDLYVGGRFTQAGDKPATGVARWDGNTWTALGQGLATGSYDGVVRALAVSRGQLYAGGNFTTAGSLPAKNIALWDGSGWSALDSGIGGSVETVFALDVRGDHLYVGGDFNRAGGLRVLNAAVWNGHQWLAPNFHTNTAVRSIAAHRNSIYIGGAEFTLPSKEVTRGVIRCTDICSAVGTGLGNGAYLSPVKALAVSQTAIYAGGGPFALPNETSSGAR